MKNPERTERETWTKEERSRVMYIRESLGLNSRDIPRRVVHEKTEDIVYLSSETHKYINDEILSVNEKLQKAVFGDFSYENGKSEKIDVDKQKKLIEETINSALDKSCDSENFKKRIESLKSVIAIPPALENVLVAIQKTISEYDNELSGDESEKLRTIIKDIISLQDYATNLLFESKYNEMTRLLSRHGMSESIGGIIRRSEKGEFARIKLLEIVEQKEEIEKEKLIRILESLVGADSYKLAEGNYRYNIRKYVEITPELQKTNLKLYVFDIDYFTAFNDLGHKFGDLALKKLSLSVLSIKSNILRNFFDDRDYGENDKKRIAKSFVMDVYRWGGEEFVMSMDIPSEMEDWFANRNLFDDDNAEETVTRRIGAYLQNQVNLAFTEIIQAVDDIEGDGFCQRVFNRHLTQKRRGEFNATHYDYSDDEQENLKLLEKAKQHVTKNIVQYIKLQKQEVRQSLQNLSDSLFSGVETIFELERNIHLFFHSEPIQDMYRDKIAEFLKSVKKNESGSDSHGNTEEADSKESSAMNKDYVIKELTGYIELNSEEADDFESVINGVVDELMTSMPIKKTYLKYELTALFEGADSAKDIAIILYDFYRRDIINANERMISRKLKEEILYKESYKSLLNKIKNEKLTPEALLNRDNTPSYVFNTLYELYIKPVRDIQELKNRYKTIKQESGGNASDNDSVIREIRLEVIEIVNNMLQMHNGETVFSKSLLDSSEFESDFIDNALNSPNKIDNESFEKLLSCVDESVKNNNSIFNTVNDVLGGIQVNVGTLSVVTDEIEFDVMPVSNDYLDEISTYYKFSNLSEILSDENLTEKFGSLDVTLEEVVDRQFAWNTHDYIEEYGHDIEAIKQSLKKAIGVDTGRTIKDIAQGIKSVVEHEKNHGAQYASSFEEFRRDLNAITMAIRGVYDRKILKAHSDKIEESKIKDLREQKKNTLSDIGEFIKWVYVMRADELIDTLFERVEEAKRKGKKNNVYGGIKPVKISEIEEKRNFTLPTDNLKKSDYSSAETVDKISEKRKEEWPYLKRLDEEHRGIVGKAGEILVSYNPGESEELNRVLGEFASHVNRCTRGAKLRLLVDKLTGAFNDFGFRELGQKMFDIIKENHMEKPKERTPENRYGFDDFTVVAPDQDLFKAFNEGVSHKAGDVVLRNISIFFYERMLDPNEVSKEYENWLNDYRRSLSEKYGTDLTQDQLKNIFPTYFRIGGEESIVIIQGLSSRESAGLVESLNSMIKSFNSKSIKKEELNPRISKYLEREKGVSKEQATILAEKVGGFTSGLISYSDLEHIIESYTGGKTRDEEKERVLYEFLHIGHLRQIADELGGIQKKLERGKALGMWTLLEAYKLEHTKTQFMEIIEKILKQITPDGYDLEKLKSVS